MTDIRIYPVKGFRGHALEAAAVEPWGLSADRRWMVVDLRGRFLTQRQHPVMAVLEADLCDGGLRLSQRGAAPLFVPTPAPDGDALAVEVWNDRVTARAAGPEADAFVSAALGIAARLVHMADPAAARRVDPDYAAPEDRVSFADGFPLLVTSAASLEDLNGRLDAPVPMDRFRPNLVVAGPQAWEEDGWTRLRVGAVLLDAVKPCARCAVTTVDQASGEKSPTNEPIRTLQTFRRNARGLVMFGQNLIPRSTGTIRVGDVVEILA